MLKIKLLLLFVLSIFILGACKDEDNAQIEVEASPNEVQENNEESSEEALKFIAPLTGERIAEEVTTRPFAVMINNHTQARPQSGISYADLVYEILVEADATRYLAVFQSHIPENIGPVRSARYYFINIAKGLDAFYVAHGYSPEAYEMLKKGVVDHINGIQYDGTYFKRSSDRKAPHNSYISSENLDAFIEKQNISMQLSKNVEYTFDDNSDNVKIGEKANEIRISYTNQNSPYSSIYTYDKENQLYLKSSPSTPTVDALNGEQVALSNVLFFEAPHKVVDSEGRRDIDLEVGGKAYVFQQGIMREVQWKNIDDLLVALESDGTQVKLTPGKTWIHIVPTSPGIETSVLFSE